MSGLTEGRPEAARRTTPEREARRLCDPGRVARWKTARPGAAILATAAIWSQLVLAWAVALAGPAWLWPAAFVSICACVCAMQLWVHEASHFLLFRSRNLNDAWATIWFAAPIGMSVAAYRRFHMTHHAQLGTAGDLDRFAYNIDIRGPRALARVLLRTLSGYEGLRIALGKYLGGRGGDVRGLAATAAWNLALVGACVWSGRWYLYLALWSYPIVAVAVAVNALRSIAEHQPEGFAGCTDGDIAAPVRTTRPGPIEKWLMYQAAFNYHFEHHLLPAVPASRLPEVHRHLVQSGFYVRHPDLLQRSGIGKVLQLSRAPA